MADLIAFTEEDFARLLREATGVDDVKPDQHPRVGATVMLDSAIRSKSTQRLSLQQRDGRLALRACPAELKPQAEALYQTGRARRLTDFVTAHRQAWLARPNPHLAFRNAHPDQRLYLDCQLEITEYIQRWTGNDFAQIRAHHHDQIRQDLWPWLQERGYAGSADDQKLDEFLRCLGRRDAHLRPSIALHRTWRWPDAADLDQRGTLASEIRTAIAELLTALDEPLPPACTPISA
jgi:hypothetical protein